MLYSYVFKSLCIKYPAIYILPVNSYNSLYSYLLVYFWWHMTESSAQGMDLGNWETHL